MSPSSVLTDLFKYGQVKIYFNSLNLSPGKRRNKSYTNKYKTTQTEEICIRKTCLIFLVVE